MTQNGNGTTAPHTFNLGPEVRSFLDSDRKRWFLFCDLRKALELQRPECVQKDTMRSVKIQDSMGRERIARCLPEPALVDMLLRSTKPLAKDFQHWFKEQVVSQDARARAIPWAVTSDNVIHADLIYQMPGAGAE